MRGNVAFDLILTKKKKKEEAMHSLYGETEEKGGTLVF